MQSFSQAKDGWDILNHSEGQNSSIKLNHVTIKHKNSMLRSSVDLKVKDSAAVVVDGWLQSSPYWTK